VSDDVPYALRLPKKLHAAVKKIAKADGRSVNFVITQACVEYVKDRFPSPPKDLR